MSWTDERIELLEKLWNDGLSASRIADKLGDVTRNAVIGKVHRLGLSGRAKCYIRNPLRRAPTINARRLRELQVNPRRTPPAAPKAPARKPRPIATSIEATEAALMLTVLELGPRQCRYPIGDPQESGFGFCGRYAHGPYCDPHHGRTHRPG